MYCSECHTVLHTEALEKPYPHHYDIDRSGSINIADVNELLILLSSVTQNESPETLSRYDMNEDGYVNIEDLNDLLTYLAST